MMTQHDLSLHPAAEIFPEMDEQEFQQLEHDISANGLQEPLTLFEGKLLDGRHRLRACLNLGIPPRFQECEGDPLSYVLTKNLHRRHLGVSQRAIMAARSADGRQGGDRTKAQNCALTHGQAAELFNVSERQVDKAAKLLKAEKSGKVGAAVIGAVFGGRMSIHKAMREITDSSNKPQTEGSAQHGYRVDCGNDNPGKKWLRSPERLTSRIERICVQMEQLEIEPNSVAAAAGDRMERLADACRRRIGFGVLPNAWSNVAGHSRSLCRPLPISISIEAFSAHRPKPDWAPLVAVRSGWAWEKMMKGMTP